MDKVELDAIRERCDKATPGPWKTIERGNSVVSHGVVTVAYDGHPQQNVCSSISPKTGDADFIAHSREDIPALLSHIDELTAENERLKEAQRWIPVTEKLPDNQQDVFIWFDRCGGDQDVGWWSATKKAWFVRGFMLCYNVTHWMPLPKPPKEASTP